MGDLTRTCFSAMKQMTLLEKTQYLYRVVQENLAIDFEDVGFCYWHISDNFALLRDSRSLYSNHCAFAEYISAEGGCYLYWPVSDATQRLTLEIGGYTEFWWELYSNAVLNNVHREFVFAEFCAHRAALYVNPLLPHTRNNLSFAIKNFKSFLDRTKDKPEYQFYMTIYLSLASRFSPVNYSEILSQGKSLLKGLHNKSDDKTVPGEWDSFTVPFSEYKQSVVGINAAINALLYGEEFKMAKELYNSAIEFGMSKNRYIEGKLY